MTTLFIIVGAPAVGKSSLCQSLAQSFTKSIHIPVDDVREMVVAGLINPNPSWTSDLQLQVTLARESSIAMASTYCASGFTTFIDDFYDPLHLREYERISTRVRNRVVKIILFPSKDVAKQRNIQRSGGEAHIDEGIDIVYDSLTGNIDKLRAENWHILDNSTMGIEETSVEIRRYLK